MLLPPKTPGLKPRHRAVLAGLGVAVVVLHGALVQRLSDAQTPAAPAATVRPAAVQLVVHRAAHRVEPAPAADPPALNERVVQKTVPAASAPPRRVPPASPVLLRASFSPIGAMPSVPAANPHADAPDVPPPEGIAAVVLAATSSDAAPARPDAGPAVPTYRTRIPTAAKVVYRLSRSGLVGTGELDWRPEAGAYTLRLEGKLPLIGTLITQTSRGRFDPAGLAPERYTDQRIKRGEQAANFQRAAGVISFSGQSPELAITPGVQDRLSVMVQLAAIAAGWSKPPPVGEHVLVRVVGARGDAHVWSLRYEGPQAVATPEGSVAALRFLREPETPQDTRAEFWLDPARQHLPVRARIADGSGDALELLRTQ